MSGDGKVAIHRWFAEGENWATHPWFRGRERQLVAALAPHIQTTGQEFAVAGLGGTLIGETVPDPDCPDPKARSRHPTILRAVFFSHPPTDRQRRALLADLRRLDVPPQPGADAQLEIRAPRSGQPTNTSGSPAPRSKKPFVILAAAAVLLVAGGLVVASLVKSGDGPNPGIPKTDPKNATPPASGKPATTAKPPTVPMTPGDDADLTPVGGEVPYLNQRTARRLRQQIGNAGKYDHPYVVFLNEMAGRLPESAPACKDSADVRQGLRKLYEALQPGDDTAEWPADRLRKAIDSAMDYDAWRQKAGRRVYRDRDKPLDDALRRALDPFRNPERALRDTAAAMAALLETWGEAGAKEQAARAPLATADRFFAVLTRPANLPSPVTVDHPHVAFLRRLPAEPVGGGRAFEDAADVAVALRFLAYLFDRDFDPKVDRTPAVELVSLIGDDMDYARWVKGRKETFRDADAELPPEVKRAIKRFDR